MSKSKELVENLQKLLDTIQSEQPCWNTEGLDEIAKNCCSLSVSANKYKHILILAISGDDDCENIFTYGSRSDAEEEALVGHLENIKRQIITETLQNVASNDGEETNE